MSTYKYRDQLSIDTPEQVALNLPIAGLGSRILAQLADLSLQVAFYLVLVFFISLAFPRGAASSLSRLSDRQGLWLMAGLIFVSFLIFWGYYTLFEAFSNGQTPGKRWNHIRVIKDTGRQITLFESLTRNLLRVIDWLPSVYIAGIVTILISKQNKRLGDLLAGTIVIRQEISADAEAGYSLRTITPPPTPPPAQAMAADHGIAFDPTAISLLSAEDLVIIETFFERIPDLDVDTIDRIATQMLRSLCRKMRIDVPASPSNRRCLDAIAHSLREVAAFRR